MKLQSFKKLAHEQLDLIGIASHPEGRYARLGCRFGERLRLFQDQLNEARHCYKILFHKFTEKPIPVLMRCLACGYDLQVVTLQKPETTTTTASKEIKTL